MDARTSTIFPFSTGNLMQNSMALFIFSALDRKHLFWTNLAQNIKLVSLSWNIVPSLIRICRFQWWCWYFLFYMGNTFFWENLVQKINILRLNLNLVPRLIRICRIHWWCWYFLFHMGKTLFGQMWFKKSKLSI